MTQGQTFDPITTPHNFRRNSYLGCSISERLVRATAVVVKVQSC